MLLWGGGNSPLADFGEIGKITPSTLRYVKVLRDLILHFGDLNGLKVCEIGVGYGGQARLIFAKFPKLLSYTFVDLSSVLALTQKYLSHFNEISIALDFVNLNKLQTKEYDLVISNYAFSELSREIQDLYIEKIIKHSKHGYITYNDISPENLASYKINEYEKIIGKKLKILKEEPLTNPLNKIVVW